MFISTLRSSLFLLSYSSVSFGVRHAWVKMSALSLIELYALA